MARKANPALMKPLEIDETLTAVVGSGPMPRGQITKKLWDYIKAHKLQDPQKGRIIRPDEKLKAVLGGKSELDMLQMGKYISEHVKK